MDYSDFDVWEFKRNENDRWVWRRLTADGDVRLACRDAFEDVDECVQDARRCGYMGSPLPQESARA